MAGQKLVQWSVEGVSQRLPFLLRKQFQVPKKKRVDPKKWLFSNGDHVAVVKGEYKGQQGIVKASFQDRNEVIVRGVNLYRKYTDDQIKSTKQARKLMTKRGIYSIEGPINYHKLKLIDCENAVLEFNNPTAYSKCGNLLVRHLRAVLNVCKCRRIRLVSQYDDGRIEVKIEPENPDCDRKDTWETRTLESLRVGEQINVYSPPPWLVHEEEDGDDDEMEDFFGQGKSTAASSAAGNEEEIDESKLDDDNDDDDDDDDDDEETEDNESENEKLEDIDLEDFANDVDAKGFPIIRLKSIFHLSTGSPCAAHFVNAPKAKFKEGEEVVVVQGEDKGKIGSVINHYFHKVHVEFGGDSKDDEDDADETQALDENASDANKESETTKVFSFSMLERYDPETGKSTPLPDKVARYRIGKRRPERCNEENPFGFVHLPKNPPSEKRQFARKISDIFPMPQPGPNPLLDTPLDVVFEQTYEPAHNTFTPPAAASVEQRI